MARQSREKAIDDLMERASGALARAEYFDAARLARDAMNRARLAQDFDRLARITLPFQEARRQIRQGAADAGEVTPLVALPDGRLAPGAYLLQPPLIGADARGIRDLADRRRTPTIVLTREPMTRAGLWPVVAVAAETIRVRVQPPPPPFAPERDDSSPTRDRLTGPIPMSWMLSALEALGDAAVARVEPSLPPAWRVDDLLDAIDAIPDHENLTQALAAAARQAIGVPVPERPRRRAYMDDPNSF